MGFLDKLRKAQTAFDENWIMEHKEYWKKQYQNLTTEELKRKLEEMESHPQFNSWKSAKRSFWRGGFGAIEHIGDREKESQRRALRELLGLNW